MANAYRNRPLGLLTLLGMSALIALAPLQAATPVSAAFPQCNDGLDNDGDGDIDYPVDVDCTSLSDDTEGAASTAIFTSITDGKETVYPGDTVQYVISISSDRNDQRDVDVRLQLPHQANLVSSDGGSREGSQIVWRNVTLYPGQTRKLTVSVQVNPNASENQLMIAEAVAGGSRASDTTRVLLKPIEIPPSPLTVSISDGKQFAEPGETLTYTVIVGNENHEPRVFTLRTQLPTELEFVSASANPVVDNRVVEWRDHIVHPGEAVKYTISAKIRSGTPDLQALRVRVNVDGKAATDTTSVFRGVVPGAYSVAISDGQEFARPGEILTYDVVLKNRDEKLGTDISVSTGIPRYTEFVGASEGGHWTGTNVVWSGLTVSPHGERRMQVQLRVRSDAPLGTRLQHSVETKGHHAVDITEVAGTSDSASSSSTNRNIVLRKVSDRDEVKPGDTVTYTVLLRNTTGKTITDIVVEDRMDTRYMTVLRGEGGSMSGDRIVWNIRELAPGEEWTVRYTVKVDPNTPHGISLANVVTVTGNGFENLSLTQRVHTGTVNVVRDLPETGAPMDVLFLGLTGLLGIAPAAWQRRKLLGA